MLETRAQFGRRCGVSRQRVGQWLDERKILPDALVREGKATLIDVEKAQEHLRKRLDPSQRFTGANGDKTKLDPKPESGQQPVSVLDNPAFAAVKSLTEVGDVKAMLLGLKLAYGIGASAANLALAAGAPVKVAHMLKDFMTVCFIGQLEEALAWLDVPGDNLTFSLNRFDDLDWKQRAADFGERHDPNAWEAWAVERSEALEAAGELSLSR